MRFITTGVVVGVLAASAQSGTVDAASALSDNTTFVTNFQTVYGSNTAVNHVDTLSGTTLGFNGVAGFDNGDFSVDVSATDGGSFFMGLAQDLVATNTGDWFNGGGPSQPADGTFVLAFGNNAFNSNEVVLEFVPGVTAFAFNYDDLEPATLTVVFRDGLDGTLEEVNVNPNSAQGFLSMVADSGDTIESIILRQNSGTSYNDGFTFYGFQTVQVVPLPAPVIAGLGLLGTLGVARRIRQK